MGTGGWRFGAGRPGWRLKAEGCLRLNVRDLKRRHVLGATGWTVWRWTNTQSGEESGSISIAASPDHLQLCFVANGIPVTQHVEITRTACTFGGTRAWLHCPRCSRRVGVLYFSGGAFKCRRCGGVAYTTQSEDAIARSWRRQHKIEAKLGNGWSRPKGMHKVTHSRLLEEIARCETSRDDALWAFAARNPLLARLLDEIAGATARC